VDNQERKLNKINDLRLDSGRPSCHHKSLSIMDLGANCPHDLARELSWLPAVENREGVFIQFERAAAQEWQAHAAVVERGQWLRAGFKGWKQQLPQSKREFSGLPYFLLHSLSRLLLTGCGTATTSPARATSPTPPGSCPAGSRP
jgi:hypothetical protein